MPREIRVGLLIVLSLVVLGVGIFLVGEKSNLFTRTNDYTVRFKNVGGLAVGNPVQLNGVTVGQVEDVVLPPDLEETLLTVRVSVESRYEDRIREDSLARIKTLGLLGDKYVELSSGTQESSIVPNGGEIRAAPVTDVDEIIESGGDVVQNIMAVSASLRTILSRMERGEGLLGSLTMETESGAETITAVRGALDSTQRILDRVERGEGTLGRLLADDTLGRELESSLGRLNGVLGQFEEGDGIVPALLHDGETRDRIEGTLGSLESVVGELSALIAEVREGDGLLPRLLADEEYGREVSEELKALIRNLNLVSQKLERGDGTLGQLLEDPSVYEAVNDILVGIEESRLLRWLIRNRQKKGIEKRYEEAQEAPEAPAAVP